MKLMNIEVFSQASNLAVVRVPGRKFPGSVVQGDSLAILVQCARSIHEQALTTGSEELIDECSVLLDLLSGRLEHYEQVIAEHGIPKPY